jgi:hypothetical protein
MNRNEAAGETHDPQDADGDVEGADLRSAARAAADLARESPHAALAVAAFAGFILGGGLTPRLLGTAAMMAGRTYLGRAMRETLAMVVQEQIGGARPGE